MPRSEPATIRTIDPDEAERLVSAGEVRILDVRTPEEFTGLGHIPGAILVPVQVIPSAAATLPRDGRPLLVCCEHGIRSVEAARFLARAGIAEVMNMSGGMSVWRGPRVFSPDDGAAGAGPSSWLLENADLLPRGGRTLDLACGRGRHALLMAAARFEVTAVDRDGETVEFLRATAGRLGLPLRADRVDLEVPGVDLGRDAYALILGFHYLHRPLFPAIVRALQPGGLLLYETFTVDQAARGKPTNPDFLLEHGELLRLVAPLEILRQRDGEFEARMVAAVSARKDGAAGRN